MIKKIIDQNMSYREELLNSIEPNFIFDKKPINRFKTQKTETGNHNKDKSKEITELKKLINSIQNCNLKNNSQNLIWEMVRKSIMIIGEALIRREKNGKLSK